MVEGVPGPGLVSPRLTSAQCSDCPAGPGWGSAPAAPGCSQGRAAPRQAPASCPPAGRPGLSSRPPAPDVAPGGGREGSEGTTTTSACLVPREGVLGGTSVVSRWGIGLRVSRAAGMSNRKPEPRVSAPHPGEWGRSREGRPWTGSGSGPPLTQSPQRVAALADPITFIRRPVCAVTAGQLSHPGPPPPPTCSLGHWGCQLIRGPAGSCSRAREPGQRR